jgi:hypothetical protein
VKRSNRNCPECPVKRTVIENADYFVSGLIEEENMIFYVSQENFLGVRQTRASYSVA